MGKRKLTGISVIALVFGMMVAGCGNGGSSDINYLTLYNLSTANPSNAALSTGGLTQAQFDQIRDIAGGGFQGWAVDLDGEELVMAWAGRSVEDFNRLANLLDDLFGEFDRDSGGGFHTAAGDSYGLEFFASRVSEGGFFVAAGTMIAFFWQ